MLSIRSPRSAARIFLRRLAVLFLAAGAACGGRAAAEGEMLFTPERQVIRWDSAPGLSGSMGLGGSLRASGDTAVFYGPDTEGPHWAQALHVFTRQQEGWTFQQKLRGDAIAPDVEFATAMAIDGDTLVVAASAEDKGEVEGAGCLLVYHRSGGVWGLQAKIQTEDAERNDRFGFAVAVHGDTIVALAHGDPLNGGDNAGHAYFFHRQGGTWVQQGKLPVIPYLSDGSSYLGNPPNLALQGDTAMIGARHTARDNQPSVGTAFLFKREAGVWSADGSLSPADCGAYDFFGASIEMEGDTALIAAVQGGVHSGLGKVYVYERQAGAWNLAQRLDCPVSADMGLFANFGGIMSLEGGRAAIGAPSAGMGGCAFLYLKRDGLWTPAKQLLPPYDVGTHGGYARGLALLGDTLLVDSYEEDPDSDAYAPHQRSRDRVEVRELLEGEGPETLLIRAASFDDGDEQISRAEWDAYLPALKSTRKLFDLIDTDASGHVTYPELAAIRGARGIPAPYKLWLERLSLAADLDADGNLLLSRAEILPLWMPGQGKAVDAFIKRLRVYDPDIISLKQWIAGKKLPSAAKYAAAKKLRASRAAAAAEIDGDSDGNITREEFAALFPSGTKPAKVDAFWRAATATPKKGIPPAGISAAAFIEARKLPKLPQ